MKLFNFVASVVGVLFSAMIIAIAFMLLYPFKVMEVSKVEVLTPVVRLGDDLDIKITYCKFVDAEATVTRTFFNDRAVSLTPYISHLPKGCNSKIITLKVPENMFASEYSLITCNGYKVNPIRNIDVCYSTEKFMILPAEKDLPEHLEDDDLKFKQLFREVDLIKEKLDLK
jgi:hypothetical protein